MWLLMVYDILFGYWNFFIVFVLAGSPCSDSDYIVFLVLVSCRFDSLRITPRSLDILTKGPPVCGDLAVSLSQAGPQFTQVSLTCAFVDSFSFSWANTSSLIVLDHALQLCNQSSPVLYCSVNFERWVPAFQRLSSMPSHFSSVPAFPRIGICMYKVSSPSILTWSWFGYCLHCMAKLQSFIPFFQYSHCPKKNVIVCLTKFIEYTISIFIFSN